MKGLINLLWVNPIRVISNDSKKNDMISLKLDLMVGMCDKHKKNEKYRIFLRKMDLRVNIPLQLVKHCNNFLQPINQFLHQHHEKLFKQLLTGKMILPTGQNWKQKVLILSISEKLLYQKFLRVYREKKSLNKTIYNGLLLEENMNHNETVL